MTTSTTPGVRTVTVPMAQTVSQAVSTSGLALIGATPKGPLNIPTVITSWEEFQRVFGTFSTTLTAPLAAYCFFSNGGTRLVVVRVASDDAVAATGYISTEVQQNIFTGDGSDTTASATLTGTPIVPGSLEIVYQRSFSVVDEELIADAGGDTSFSGTLAHTGVTVANVVIDWTSGGDAMQQVIAADGSVTGDGTPANTTLNRTTGVIYVDLTGDLPDASTGITATYSYYGPEVTITDDGEGALQSGATGTINDTNGALSVTFSNAPDRKSTRLNSSHVSESRMPSSA